MTILGYMSITGYKWIFGVTAALLLGLMVYLIVKLILQKHEAWKTEFIAATIAEGETETEAMASYKLAMTKKRQRAVKVLIQILLYLFLSVMAIIVIFPFYWMLISSLKSQAEYEAYKPTFWPTQGFHFENYTTLFSNSGRYKYNLGTLFLNTLYVGLVSTVLSLVITVLSAFAFARLEFKGKNVLFGGLLATMMIPGELFTLTNYRTISYFDWDETFTVLIVPFLVSVFYIYLLRQNFMQIPDELYYAAKVDGTSDLKYLWKVMIPMSMPTLISITILKMMGAWNSYMWPMLVATDEGHTLVTFGLRNMFSAEDTNYPAQMAAVTMVSIPLFLVFAFLRKYIMRGVGRSGLKG